MTKETPTASTKKNPFAGTGIRPRGKDVYQIQFYVTGVDGKLKRQFETFHGGVREVKERWKTLHADKGKGLLAMSGSLTLEKHLEDWLRQKRVSARSREDYGIICRRWLVPRLGATKLKDLTPQMIRKYYADMEAEGVLSNRTIYIQHRVLSAALRYAVAEGLIPHNPCGRVTPPTPVKRDMKFLNQHEVPRFLEYAKDSQYYPVIYTAIWSGMRMGELLALRWRDVDLDGCEISVVRSMYKRHKQAIFKTPKTERSRRSFRIIPKLALFLKHHREQQEALLAELRVGPTGDSLVFPHPTGVREASPGVVTYVFARLAKGAVFPGLRFHDCRHTFAFLMFKSGASAYHVSKALGHHSVAFTLDTYGHWTHDMGDDTLKRLNDMAPDMAGTEGEAELRRAELEEIVTKATAELDSLKSRAPE